MAEMNELVGQAAELVMVIEIKRAATGKTETIELVGSSTAEEAQQLGIKEANQCP